MAIFRAVENRRSLVRAANTGISGFVAPTGDILQASDLFIPATLTAPLPLIDRQTVYTRGGHLFGLVCLMISLLLLLLHRLR